MAAEETKDLIKGKFWEGRNWSADSKGSIHDDATAQKLGMRGGTVAGNIHLDQFAPMAVDIFGQDWFEDGNVSMYFANATTDREKVQVIAEKREPGSDQVNTWMVRDDGMTVAQGSIGMGDTSGSALRSRDMRAVDSSELKILAALEPGMSLGDYDYELTTDLQYMRIDNGLISDPLPWYQDASPWGGAIASPSSIVQFLWGEPMAGLRAKGGDLVNAVGLYGAIEVAHINGPVMLGGKFKLVSEIVALTQSPQTEGMWFESSALNEDGDIVATHLMLLRFMKASSPLYQ